MYIVYKKEEKKIDSDVNCGQTARIDNERWKIIVSDATNEIEVLQVHSNCIQFFFLFSSPILSILIYFTFSFQFYTESFYISIYFIAVRGLG